MTLPLCALLARHNKEKTTMINRLEIVTHYIEEQRQTRQGVVGAFVVGSVSRSEDGESSDIDVALLVDDSGVLPKLGETGAWRDGIYLDLFVAPQTDYNNLEKVLLNPFATTHLNDALILYDPDGVFTSIQQEVRAVYMQPEILRRRLQYFLDWVRKGDLELQAAVVADDPIAICRCVGNLLFGFFSLALLKAGITPSTSRGFIQLGAVDANLTSRLVEFAGGYGLDRVAVEALISLSQAILETDEKAQPLAAYFVKKAMWMAQNGFLQEAFLPLWHPVTFAAEDCLENPSLGVQVTPLAQQWLAATGWQGQAALAAKLQSAQGMVEQAEVMVAAV
jgi:predicted nucleotidyltransferase